MRRRRGQSLVEVTAGMLVIVPVALALFDVAMVAIGGDICNELCKQAARAAANCANQADATVAVADVLKDFKGSSLFSTMDLSVTAFQGNQQPPGVTTVVCKVTVKLPVSVPLLNVGPTLNLQTQSTEAILGIAPTRPPNVQ